MQLRSVTSLLSASLIACMFALAGCSPATSNSDKLVIALEPDKNPDAMLEDRKLLEAYLADALGQPVSVIIPLSSNVINEGMRNGTIDIAYLSSTATALLAESGAVEVLLATLNNGKAYYNSIWLSLKEKPYTSIADLKGKPIAFASRTSTSGFMIPAWDLYKKGLITVETGIEGYFGSGNVYYGVGYVSAVEQVLSGNAEAAAVSNYVFFEDRHLTVRQKDQLKVIQEQGPVPSHVLAIRTGISAEQRQSIRNVFLRANEENPALVNRMWGGALQPVDKEEHLRVTREALALVRQL